MPAPNNIRLRTNTTIAAFSQPAAMKAQISKGPNAPTACKRSPSFIA